MRYLTHGTAAVLLLLALAACERPAERTADFNEREANAWAIRQFNQDAKRNAIVRQRAMMPHHFVTGSAELNELGEEHVSVLAEHYRRHPGQLRLWRGESDDALYQQRIETLHAALADAGIAEERVQIAPGLPGGDGAPSREVIEDLEKEVDLRTNDGRGFISTGN